MIINPLIRIMLVDDHAVVRAGIKRLLEQESRFSVVAEAESGERAYVLFGEFCPIFASLISPCQAWVA